VYRIIGIYVVVRGIEAGINAVIETIVVGTISSNY